MKTLIAVVLLAGASVWAAVPPQTPPAPASAAQPTLQFKELPEDTKLKTASGATFTVSKGWHVAQTESMIVIQEPERELAAAFVEISGADRRGSHRAGVEAVEA